MNEKGQVSRIDRLVGMFRALASYVASLHELRMDTKIPEYEYSTYTTLPESYSTSKIIRTRQIDK